MNAADLRLTVTPLLRRIVNLRTIDFRSDARFSPDSFDSHQLGKTHTRTARFIGSLFSGYGYRHSPPEGIGRRRQDPRCGSCQLGKPPPASLMDGDTNRTKWRTWFTLAKNRQDSVALPPQDMFRTVWCPLTRTGERTSWTRSPLGLRERAQERSRFACPMRMTERSRAVSSGWRWKSLFRLLPMTKKKF